MCAARRDHQARREANDASRNTARHHAEPWSDDELDQLTGYWDGTEETLVEIAELLGRTVEACRQRYYYPFGQKKPATTRAPAHEAGWLVGYCTTCGTHTDVWCDGTNIRVCDDCR